MRLTCMDWARATLPTKLHVTLVPPAKPDPDGGLEATDGAPCACLQRLLTGMWTSGPTSALATPSLRLSAAYALMLITGSALFVVYYADSLGDALAPHPAATDLSITSAWSPRHGRDSIHAACQVPGLEDGKPSVSHCWSVST